MSDKVSFNGLEKTITVKPMIDNVNIQKDLYSGWKVWSILDNNLCFLQAFRTFGGDETVEGQITTQYFFLMNGWRVVVDGQHVNFSSNLYTDEGETPFVIYNGGTVTNKTSDSPTVSMSGSTLAPEWVVMI